MARAFANPKVKPIWNAEVEEVLNREKGVVTGLRLRDTVTGKNEVLDVPGVFVATGHVPNTQLFKGQLAMNEAGCLKQHDGSMTNIPGVFGAGMGCMAAIDAERYLSSLNN